MSDKFSRNLTITLLVFLILYYKYVRFIINQKGDYNQNKCDPLNLVIGGITGSASDDMFEKCAAGKTAGVVDSEFNTYANDVNTQLNDTNNYMKSATTGAGQDIENRSADYIEKQNALETTASAAAQDISDANENISTGASILSETITTINSIVSKVESAFNSFINSNPIRKI